MVAILFVGSCIGVFGGGQAIGAKLVDIASHIFCILVGLLLLIPSVLFSALNGVE